MRLGASPVWGMRLFLSTANRRGLEHALLIYPMRTELNNQLTNQGAAHLTRGKEKP